MAEGTRVLTKLRIKNFQAHEDLTIRFDPRITSIVGSTDAGKSAVIRALRWLAFNKPGGEAFVRSGADHVEVTLRVDGQKIRRRKSKGTNFYQIDSYNYEAFGAEPPGDVAHLLNLAAANFQSQHDAPFWFSESAGEVSRQLNQIINLGSIDSTLAWFGQESRRVSSALEITTGRLANSKTAKRRLASALDADAALVSLERTRSSIAVEAARTAALAGLLETALKLRCDVENAGKTSHSGLAATRAGDDWASARASLDEFEQLVDQVGALTFEIVAIREETKKLEREWKSAVGEECPVCGQPVPKK